MIKNIGKYGKLSHKQVMEFYGLYINIQDKFSIFWVTHPINKKKIFHKDIIDRIKPELDSFIESMKNNLTSN